jgi:hypothetical protein
MISKAMLRLLPAVIILACTVSAIAQEEHPFIEPAEHARGKRAMKMATLVQTSGTTGRWETIDPTMPINPVHVALMYTGRVLVVTGSGNDPDQRIFTAGVFDPNTQTIKTFTIPWDMFCNGMVVMPDGRPFVIGGTIRYDPFFGQFRTAAFNPGTEMFSATKDMAGGRWYPTGTVLGNGTIMAISGLKATSDTTNTTIEIYTPATNSWASGGNAFPNVPLYPRQNLLPNGKVFESGANANSKLYDPVSKTWTDVATTIFGQSRDYGTSVLLPLTPANNFRPKVIIMGGGPGTKNVTATTEVIDLSAARPVWTKGPAMVAPRVQLNATILPNGKVLVSGGSSKDEDISTAVLRAELYDPATNTFAPAGSMEFARVYHSNTLLLPDGRVLAVGGNPERKVYEPHIEIYYPPYLFNSNGTPAKRPAIASVTPSTITYGGAFQVRSADAESIRSVVLIRPGAVTHAFDMEQRLVGLTYTTSSGYLNVTAPANGNLAPPGYYLLFIINGSGVPSVGKFVQLK